MGKKEELYHVVAEAAVSYGAENLTAKHIAEIWGKSEALLYKYCKGKDDLLQKTYEYICNLLLKGITKEMVDRVLNEERIEVSLSILWRIMTKKLISMNEFGYFYIEYTELMEVPNPPKDRAFMDAPTGCDLYDKMCITLKERAEKAGMPWVAVKRMMSDHGVLNVIRATRRGEIVTDLDLDNLMMFMRRGMVGGYLTEPIADKDQ